VCGRWPKLPTSQPPTTAASTDHPSPVSRAKYPDITGVRASSLHFPFPISKQRHYPHRVWSPILKATSAAWYIKFRLPNVCAAARTAARASVATRSWHMNRYAATFHLQNPGGLASSPPSAAIINMRNGRQGSKRCQPLAVLRSPRHHANNALHASLLTRCSCDCRIRFDVASWPNCGVDTPSGATEIEVARPLVRFPRLSR
jgi:hypothetical protein